VPSRCPVAWASAAVCLLASSVAQAQAQESARALAEAQAQESAPAQSTAPAQSAAPAQDSAPAQDNAVNSLPGSPRPVGLSLSPEAPPTPPAPGGRAPSFGAPADPDAWAFRVSGRISGYGQVGIGRKRLGQPSRTVLHTPPLIFGRSPFYAGPGGTLNFQYGSQTVTAFVSLEAQAAGQQWTGYYRSEYGPRLRTAYVAVNPAPIGDLRLRFQVGAFPANYGAPGPWGWGIFGPVLAVHGYGGTGTANYDLSPNTQLTFEYGVAAVPEVDEATARGTFSDWPEAGLSTIVNHAHLGISYQNKYFAKLHVASAEGRNDRKYLDDVAGTPQIERGVDGHMDVAALELRWMADPYGQLGITPGYWDFNHALSVHNGIWWGLDWTAGGREMTSKFLGPQSGGTGKIAAVSAEYDFSVSRILLQPKPFDGNGPDLRVGLAFLPFWTLSTADPAYRHASGYYVGASVEHVLLSWLSTAYMLYGESRDAAQVDVFAHTARERWTAYSGTFGFILHSDWQSQDRIVAAYSRYFYSKFTDNNPALPLDRDVFTLGASVAF
jgi:hypothetical protein